MAVERSLCVSFHTINIKEVVGYSIPFYMMGGPGERPKTGPLTETLPEVKNLWELRLSQDEREVHSFRVGRIGLFAPSDILNNPNQVKIHMEFGYPIKLLESPWEKLINGTGKEIDAIKENILVGISYSENKLEKFGHSYWSANTKLSYIPITIDLTTQNPRFSASAMIQEAVKGKYKFEEDADEKPQSNYLVKSIHSVVAGRLYPCK